MTTPGGRTACTVTACPEGSCPEGSVCVADGAGGTLCQPTCETDVDCNFCRADADAICSDTVETVGGTVVSACTY